MLLKSIIISILSLFASFINAENILSSCTYEYNNNEMCYLKVNCNNITFCFDNIYCNSQNDCTQKYSNLYCNLKQNKCKLKKLIRSSCDNDYECDSNYCALFLLCGSDSHIPFMLPGKK